VNASAVAESLARTFAGPPGRFLVEHDGAEGWASENWTKATVLEHVNGSRRIGLPYDPERLTFCAFDLDGKRHPEGRAWSLATAQRIVRALADLGIVAILEQSRSGQGFHVWILFDANGPRLTDARELAAALLRTLGFVDNFSEKEGVPGFYPWPQKTPGCGRVPYLPLFGATNGHRSGILCDSETGEPFGDQLAALDGAQRTPAGVFAEALAILRKIAPAPPKPERPRMQPRTFTGELSPYAAAALDGEAEAVANHPPKTGRHTRLFAAAAALGELVAGGELSRSLVEGRLRDASAANGMIGEGREPEVEKTIRDGIEAGLSKPRHGDPISRQRDGISKPERHAPEEPYYLREELDGPEEPEAAQTVEASESETKAEADADAIPELPAVCWRGGFSAFRDAYAQCTEAANAYLFGAYLVLASLALGRQARLRVGFNVYPNIFAALVGPSGGSRKSTAQGFGRDALRELDESVIHSLGVGSPEGLVKLFADDAMRPRRVLLDLGELATLLRKGAAEATRGLLPLIVDLYDCPPAVRLPNAKADVEGVSPYLCIMAGSTLEWIAASLSVEDARAGFAGRFMLFTGNPKPPIPWPPPPALEARGKALGTLRDAMSRHSVEHVYPLAFDARHLWADWYNAERTRPYTSETLEIVAQRLPLFAWKLGLIYAALEGTPELTREQLVAAIAFADYQRDTQRLVLGGLGDSLALRIEDRVKAALGKHGPLPPWRLSTLIRRVPSELLARALRNLGLVGVIEQRKQGRATVYALVSGQGSQGKAKGKAKG
jgi:hypothetical protein